ncbi:MAG: hypothetical protein RR563_04625 [Acinetobacter sp.]
MGKRFLPVIYLLMICLGVVGFFTSENNNEISKISENEVKKIKVPRSTSEIREKKILSTDDFYYDEVIDDGTVVNSLVNENLIGWGVKKNIAKDTIIQRSDLIDPNSDEYVNWTLESGYVFKSIILNSDDFTSRMVKVGDKVTVYLSYSKKIIANSKFEVVSPPETISNSGLSAIVRDARVLSVSRFIVADGFPSVKIIIELTNEDNKKLIHLENANAKTVVYLSSKHVDAMWPVSKEKVLENSRTIKELRGGR